MRHIVKTIAFVVSILIFSTCEKFELKTVTKVETGTAITLAKSICVNGKIIDLSGDKDDDYGFCYASHSNPTVIDSKISAGKPKVGDYSCNIEGVKQNTQYYIRAYCKSSSEIVYGNTVPVTTQDGVAKLATDAAISITATTVTIGGNINSDGGAAILVRGVVWSTSPNPTLPSLKPNISIDSTIHRLDSTICNKNNTDSSRVLNNTKKQYISQESNLGFTTEGNGLGTFSSKVCNLTPNITYYVRAYATNSVGTVYGNQETFKTKDGIITLTTLPVTSIDGASSVSGGGIISDGGDPIKARGVVWGTSQNPTLDNNLGITNNGAGSGSYDSKLSNLKPSTAYYVRSYASNSIGIKYGEQLQFTTTNGLPILSTSTTKGINLSTALGGGAISSDGGYSITSRGVVWSTSKNPDINSFEGISSNGSGTHIYTCNLRGLTPYKTYYVRGYATNCIGTSYGEELTFTILSDGSDILEIWEYNPVDDKWIKKGSLTYAKRDDTKWFTINQKAYFGLGHKYENKEFVYYNDIYEVDPIANTFTRRADYVGNQTIFQVGFSIGSLGFIGAGNSSSEFWCFDPAQNRWSRKADLGGSSRSLAVSFSIEGKGYIATGKNSLYLNDIWEYSPTTNSWSRKADFPGIGRWGAVGFAIGGKGYVGGGGAGDSNSPDDFYEFDPSLNRWIKKADITFANYSSTSFVIGSKAYVLGYNTLYEYNPATNIWSIKNNLPFYFASDLFCFTANGKGYALVFPSNSQKSQVVREGKQLMIEREKMNRLKIGRAF